MTTGLLVVQGVYEAFLRSDVPAVLATLAPDVEWIVPGSVRVPHAGRRRGPAEVAQFFAAVGGALEIQRFVPRQIFDAGESVFVLGFDGVRVRSTGRSYESEWLHHWKVRGRRVVYFREFIDTAAVEAAFA